MINMLCRYLSEDVAMTIIVSALQKDNPGFTISDIGIPELETFSGLDRNPSPGVRRDLGDVLSDLSKEEMERVKVMLNWDIAQGYGRLAYGPIEHMREWDLADRIVSKLGQHALFIVSVIMAYIERPDAVYDLTRKTYGQHK